MRNDILNIKNCKKIAIMGGTFDPIHYGHLVAAEAVREELNIERVIFVPTGRPPHKKNRYITHDEHRYLMTVLATVNNIYFDVSRIEIDRPGTTYTIDTIKEIKKICDRDTEIYFITGADAVNEILTWKNADSLLNMCNFIAVTRPGYDKNSLFKNISKEDSKLINKIYFIEVPALAISSTDIRNRVMLKKTIKYLLPEEVEKYIIKFDLYKNENLYPLDVETINTKLHSELTPKRFIHTQGVAQEAVKLAKHYDVDVNKALFAGLLHDCAKDYTKKEKLQMCEKYNLKLDEIMCKQIDLVHSFLGAEVAKHDYMIEDEEILNAIRYHTTGRKGMSVLEKIIYLADYIEPNRKNFDGLENIRKLSYINLDKAMESAIKNTINYNKEKERLIHPLSIEALKYYKNFKEE